MLTLALGVKESETGLAPPNLWDIAADRQRVGEEGPLQVARCTKIIPVDPEKKKAAEAVNPLGAVQGQKGADEQDKYVINIKQIAKFVVGLGERVSPTDIEEGMRVGLVTAQARLEVEVVLTTLQRRSNEVPDYDSSSTKDRRISNNDAGRGKAGRYIFRCRWLQGANRAAS